MNRIDDNLRRALQHPEPPPELAGKILTRAFRPVGKRRIPAYLLRTAAAVVLIVGLAASGLHYQRIRAERIESERAREQLIKAFRLAREQLRPFQKRLEEMKGMTITISEGEN